MPKQTNIGQLHRQFNTSLGQTMKYGDKLNQAITKQSRNTTMASRTKTATRKGKGKARGRWGSGNRQGGTGNKAGAYTTTF